MGGLRRVVPDFLIEVIAVRDLGGMTVVQARMRVRGVGSATPLDEPLWTAIEWRDGKVLWWASYHTEAEALEAVGLQGVGE